MPKELKAFKNTSASSQGLGLELTKWFTFNYSIIS